MQDNTRYKRPNDESLCQKLSKRQYAIMVHGETEAPFTSCHLENEQEGIYVDAATGEPLFTSYDKYDSACGWPSFTQPINSTCVVESQDDSHNMVRTEVRSCTGNFHLGHVFEDGPPEHGGLRYCINGEAIRFVPIEDMEVEGYSYLLAYMNKRKQEKS